EEADAVLVAELAQGLGKRHQVIIVHPNQIVRLQHLVDLVREIVVDTQVAGQIATGEFGKVDAVVQDRPQHPVGEAVVVFLVILLGEIGNDVGDLVFDDLAGLDLAARGDAATPAEPDSGRTLERGLDGNFEAAGARLAVLIRNGDPVRYYDEPRQYRSSQ